MYIVSTPRRCPPAVRFELRCVLTVVLLFVYLPCLCFFHRRLCDCCAGGTVSAGQGKKPKLGLKESFRVLGKSKYLGFLATLVLGYGLCIAMTEGIIRLELEAARKHNTTIFSPGYLLLFCSTEGDRDSHSTYHIGYAGRPTDTSHLQWTGARGFSSD